MPPNGTMYLNITALGCTPRRNAGNPLPEAIVLRKHYFFGFRPARTYLYSEFDSRSWSAHLGMGNETYGYSIAGASAGRERLCTHMMAACAAWQPVGSCKTASPAGCNPVGTRVCWRWQSDDCAHDAQSRGCSWYAEHPQCRLATSMREHAETHPK